MLVQNFLEASALHHPQKTCIKSGGQALSYFELDTRANQLANCLIEKGLKKGDRVAIFLPNCIDAVVAIFAALKADAIFFVINSSVKQRKLQYLLEDSQAKVLLAQKNDLETVLPLLDHVPTLEWVIVNEQSGHLTHPKLLAYTPGTMAYSGEKPATRNTEKEIACLVYTSGSTGEPKGIICSHGNVCFAVKSITQYLENTEDDIVINFLPLSFDYGLYQVLMVFSFGGTLILEKNFTFIFEILKTIEKEKVTGFPGVPTVYSRIKDLDLSGHDLQSLRYMTNTAAAMPPSHIQQIRQKFPWVRLYSMYGLSETKRTLYLPPEQLDCRPGSVGIAIPGTKVWVEDESGNRLGPHQIGELVVQGPHVMQGYWNDAELTRKRFTDGNTPGERICHTGDLFRMDDEGYMYFIGRMDDIIKTKGEKVAPKEVENIIYEVDGVIDVAVIGVPDPILGQAIKAIIVTNGSDLTTKEVLDHCRKNLESHMVPKMVEFRDSLPKSPSGKIVKTGLV